MSMLSAENLSVRYGEKTAVTDLSFTLEEGQWLMLVGPNGAGKSSVLSALSRSTPASGSIRYGGDDACSLSPAALARRVGVLSQQHTLSYGYTVEEVVRLGRYAHRRGFFSRADEDGEARIAEALRLTGLEALRGQSLLQLSGGEVQRAFLAQVLAQDPPVLLLDEPANHLDLPYQQQLFTLLGDWLKTPGRAVISVMHDLSLARRFGTHALLLQAGRCVAQGTVAQVLTPDNLRAVYGMDVQAWLQSLLAQWEPAAR